MRDQLKEIRDKESKIRTQNKQLLSNLEESQMETINKIYQGMYSDQPAGAQEARRNRGLDPQEGPPNPQNQLGAGQEGVGLTRQQIQGKVREIDQLCAYEEYLKRVGMLSESWSEPNSLEKKWA